MRTTNKLVSGSCTKRQIKFKAAVLDFLEALLPFTTR